MKERNMPVHYHYGKFPPANINLHEIFPLIGPATAELARFDGVLSAIPNASVLLSPLTTQEAILSSKIEGTQTNFEDVLKYEEESDRASLPPEKRKDIHEVLNYRIAMSHAVKRMQELPLCKRIIRETHAKLMEGVRGQNKSPGLFRKDQNWIGTPGSTLETARFIPISPEQLPKAMDDWELYIHTDTVDRLVQMAVLHAEFEALHPFADGNGRLGRMCIPLFMYHIGLINQPMFYISAYFEAHDREYRNRLLKVSEEEDWTGWCVFFLDAVKEQARNNLIKAKNILELYESKKAEFLDLTHSQYAIYALDFIFSYPVFSSTRFTHQEEIPHPTARKIIRQLKDNDLIREISPSRGRLSAWYIFPELVRITET